MHSALALKALDQRMASAVAPPPSPPSASHVKSSSNPPRPPPAAATSMPDSSVSPLSASASGKSRVHERRTSAGEMDLGVVSDGKGKGKLAKDDN